MRDSSTKQYRTKQKELILSCIQAHQGSFFTSKDIVSALAEQGAKVGTATVYRNLERLEEEGIIARTSIEGTSSVRYRFLPNTPEGVYFFLKCEECGDLSPHRLRRAAEALRARYRASSRAHQPH